MDQASSSQTDDGFEESKPVFYIGQHDSTRSEALTDLQYGQILNAGFTYATTPVTNAHFRQRIEQLATASIAELEKSAIPSCHPGPIVPPLTTEDTTLFPTPYTSGLVAYLSSWIDLCSSNSAIASISRQVLNLEISYANFCGIRTVIIPGPREDFIGTRGSQGAIAQYARAIQEALVVGTRLNFIIHLPMYREPGLEERSTTLSALLPTSRGAAETGDLNIDVFSSWDSWHVIRSTCSYDSRLCAAVRMPRKMPIKEVQTRWFSEPVQYLSFTPETFQLNRAGHPSMSRDQQNMINMIMRLKVSPYFLLCDVGPDVGNILDHDNTQEVDDFPSLADAAHKPKKQAPKVVNTNMYVSYLRYLERQQQPFGYLEQATLTNFQDWLQSPLQPLSDNLESVTYEVFEGDPVKYNQYELAIAEALADWSQQGKPTSSENGAVVIAVAGSGRGPLVTRALKASKTTGVPVQVWAVEKNPNAYVYLLRQNQQVWNGQVTVVKTDMRAWRGPRLGGSDEAPQYGKVDILVSELLGSFGDNELSPECLDGIQHVLAKPHGISIPESYTAHLSPISTPRIHADIRQRIPIDENAFDTPWVVRLFQLDFVAQPVGGGRFQQAWEFVHPLPQSTLDMIEARRSGGVVGGGGGSMAGGVGANDHNSRHCHLTFVCKDRGVIHGLAGYFESVLYAPAATEKEKVELSILPNNIDKKSKDMISWFPIFFPLKQPLYFPADTELEVSMWRQTDDAKVWYEWVVEAYRWVSETERVKVGASDMSSSRKVACIM